MVRPGSLGGSAAGVNAALFVSRHGKHREHVRRNVPQRRGSTTRWVTAGEGRLAVSVGRCSIAHATGMLTAPEAGVAI